MLYFNIFILSGLYFWASKTELGPVYTARKIHVPKMIWEDLNLKQGKVQLVTEIIFLL